MAVIVCNCHNNAIQRREDACNYGWNLFVSTSWWFYSLDENDSQSLSEFMDALQNTKEVDTENNRLSVPQTQEDRITLGQYCSHIYDNQLLFVWRNFCKVRKSICPHWHKYFSPQISPQIPMVYNLQIMYILIRKICWCEPSPVNCETKLSQILVPQIVGLK